MRTMRSRLLIVVLLIGLMGCVTVKECDCPPEDIWVINPYGCWTHIEEGGLEDPETDYFTVEEFEQIMDAYRESMKPDKKEGL